MVSAAGVFFGVSGRLQLGALAQCIHFEISLLDRLKQLLVHVSANSLFKL